MIGSKKIEKSQFIILPHWENAILKTHDFGPTIEFVFVIVVSIRFGSHSNRFRYVSQVI